MTTDRPHWLDIIPTIPLARGVPVIDSDPCERAGVVFAIDTRTGQNCQRVRSNFREWDASPYARVDLDDPQGFGYALRYFRGLEDFGPETMPHSAVDGFTGMLDRWGSGETTDADRLTLARALAEVAE